MARFVSIGKYFINTDRVITVTSPDVFESIWIELDNGQNIEAEARYLPDVIGAEQTSSDS